MSDITPNQNMMNDVEVAAKAPITTALLAKIGANINAILYSILPVGSVITSLLTEQEFLNEIDADAAWVLMDGRNVAGSAYSSITGNTTVPDARGIFFRGKNNGRVDGYQDPDGEKPLGTFTNDKFESHAHPVVMLNMAEGVDRGDFQHTVSTQRTDSTSAVGGNETAPKSITVNYFIRIN